MTVATSAKAVPSDLDIAQAASLKPIAEIAADLGIEDDELELYGKYKAKINLSILKRVADRPNGKYIDVTAITPTPLGEGKSTTTMGLAQGLCKLGKKAVAAIRQPSLGPVFGIKGGAAGGGYSQVIPMEDFNLHFTGDNHAVTLAHNLCSAFLDASILHGNKLNIDPNQVLWNRVTDVSDRALRDVVIGLGGKANGYPRQTAFDITVASEVMAVLALATSLRDLRERIGRIVVAFTYTGESVTCEDLKVAGAMTVLLKDAINPNLIQTLENTPVLVHAGPFANIAHGNSSVVSDEIALKLGDYVVTESGFGADMGFEKFANIKCRYSGLSPDVVVIVATVRALKSHSGKYTIVAGKPLDPGLQNEDLDGLSKGMVNLEKHIENVRKFGVPAVVCVNAFSSDTPAEIDLIIQRSKAAGAYDAVLSTHWADGGDGAIALAEAVARAADEPSEFKLLYTDDMSIKDKIETIVREIYGGESVTYSPVAQSKIEQYTEKGFDKLPICMAKTQYSLSADPTLKGRPTGFNVEVRDIRASVGAGFLYPICGNMMTMPGLPSVPGGTRVDIDDDGNIVGLF